ncbi:MAG TPA: anti-sigma factor [Gemmatimonadaceae bacterium]|nr:anti-sigma factor [Gemmatimonadaceae bacterium]
MTPSDPPFDTGKRVAAIDCETAVRRLWDFLDGRLPPQSREEVEAHLATCVLCPPHFAFASSMQRALAESVPTVAEGEERLAERVRAALRRQLGAPDDSTR